MARILVKADIRRKSDLLDLLRSQQPRRQILGELSFSFSVDDDARHIGYIILEWESFESVRKFVNSPASHELIAEWPIANVLELLALRDIADDYGV
jgi:quinol monooxygenase YgiN